MKNDCPGQQKIHDRWGFYYGKDEHASCDVFVSEANKKIIESLKNPDGFITMDGPQGDYFINLRHVKFAQRTTINDQEEKFEKIPSAENPSAPQECQSCPAD